MVLSDKFSIHSPNCPISAAHDFLPALGPRPGYRRPIVMLDIRIHLQYLILASRISSTLISDRETRSK